MNIAKASAEDLEAALSLLGLLDTVSGGYYPSDTDSECENDPLRFDEDDRAHLDQLWKRLKGCLDMSPGFQGRVIFGGVTMMDPRNRIIDEHADVLKLPALHRKSVVEQDEDHREHASNRLRERRAAYRHSWAQKRSPADRVIVQG